eukprot:evm.model.NODE_3224_length_23392_cov_40.121708.2
MVFEKALIVVVGRVGVMREGGGEGGSGGACRRSKNLTEVVHDEQQHQQQ